MNLSTHFAAIYDAWMKRYSLISSFVTELEKTLPNKIDWSLIHPWFLQWMYVNDLSIELRTGEVRHHPSRTFTFQCVHTLKKGGNHIKYSGVSIDDMNIWFSKFNEEEGVKEGMQLDALDTDHLRSIEERLKTLVSKSNYAYSDIF